MLVDLSSPETRQMQRDVELSVISLPTISGCVCQTLVINLPRRTVPQDLASLKLPHDLDLSRGVLIFGAAPVWFYGHLVAQCHAAPWIATYHVRNHLGVVVASRIPEKAVGDVIHLRGDTRRHPAILIGGPPSSGKSVLSYTLYRTLRERSPHLKTHLFRANWDGEGNHTYETPNHLRVKQLRAENNPKLQNQPNSAQKIAKFFKDRGQEIPNIRQMMDLTLVDIGGRTDRDRIPVVQACTHYIAISNDPNKIADWRDLCEPDLRPLAVIHSVLEARVEVLQTEPFLEVIAGPWERGQDCTVPEVILERVLSVLDGTI